MRLSVRWGWVGIRMTEDERHQRRVHENSHECLAVESDGTVSE